MTIDGFFSKVNRSDFRTIFSFKEINQRKNIFLRITMEDLNVDRNRIVDNGLIDKIYFCTVCKYLLWQAHSCSSCETLVCGKCLDIWFENPLNRSKCPFGCQSSEYCLCIPAFQALLSSLNIQCRNASLGCEEVIPYDQLEDHQKNHCQYRSQRCRKCNTLVLIENFEKHCQETGLCISYPMKCNICEDLIEKVDFEEHLHSCCQKRLNQFFTDASSKQTTTRHENAVAYLQRLNAITELVDSRIIRSYLTSFYYFINMFKRAREENCSYLSYLSTLMNSFIRNWSQIPYVILMIVIAGMTMMLILLLSIHSYLLILIQTNEIRGSIYLILLTFILTYVNFIFVQIFSDGTILFCLSIFCFFFGCLLKIPLEVLQADFLCKKPILSMILGCFCLLLIKMVLFFIRFYYWFLGADLSCSIIIFLAYHLTKAISQINR